MKEIIVKSKKYGNQVALVDDKDFEYLNQFNWSIEKGKNTFYAFRRIDNKVKPIYLKMHRVILGLVDSNILTDHQDNNGLNNQRGNIRPCTISENNRNVKKKYNSTTSKYKGVCFNKKRNKWRAYIVLNNKQYYLGDFDNEIDAAICYNIKAIELHGNFASLNIIENIAHIYKPIIPWKKSSVFRGVRYRKEMNKYCSYITVNKQTIRLGNFINEIDAAKEYNTAAIKYHGEFAKLNIIT